MIEVNGQPGLLLQTNGCIHSVMTLDIVDGYIQSVYTIRNPEKLRRMNERIELQPIEPVDLAPNRSKHQ